MRRLLLLVLATVVVMVAGLGNSTAQAQTDADGSGDPGLEIRDEADVDIPSIIPRPDSGVAPQDAGDRGGALQLLLLGLIALFPVVALVAIRRQASATRKARAAVESSPAAEAGSVRS